MLPLDGNPHRYTAVVAHAEPVTRLAVSHDGRHVYTAGGASGAVHVWSVYPAFAAAAHQLGGDGIAPFVELLDGAFKALYVTKTLMSFFFFFFF